MRKGSTFWGIVFILAGIIFLLNSLGLLAINVWNVIWPLFLVFLGVWVLWGAFFSRGSNASENVSIPLEGAASARIRVNHGAGRLDAHAGAAGGNLVEGAFGSGLDWRSKRNGDALDVRMRVPAGAFPGPWMWGPGNPLDWNLALSGDIALALEFETGASENHLDLTGLRVTDLWIKTGASATELMLPTSAGHTQVRIEAGAASVVVRVPDEVAARVRVRSGLSGIDVDTQRFPRSGDAYQSPDYGMAVNKVDIEAEMGVGSIKVR